MSTTGVAVPTFSPHKRSSSTSAPNAEKSLSLQVCKDNYTQISSSEGNLRRGYPGTTLPGSKKSPLRPPTNATAKQTRPRLRHEVPNSVAEALLWSQERVGGGPSNRLTRACPSRQAYTPVNSES